MPRDNQAARRPRHRTGSVACTCLTCGAGFSIVPAKVAAGDGKYCSRPCFHASAGYRRHVRDALPGTFVSVGARAGVSPEVVQGQLFGLVARGEAHVTRLVPYEGERGRGVPTFALWFEAGPGGDPDMPLTARAALAYMNRKAILDAMPRTQTQLVTRTGYTVGTVSRLVAELHAAGKCHITRWKKSKTGAPAPVYAKGRAADAPCPFKPLTQAERNARYVEKAERTGRIEKLRARWSANQRAAAARRQGDVLVNALFGAPAARSNRAS